MLNIKIEYHLASGILESFNAAGLVNAGFVNRLHDTLGREDGIEESEITTSLQELNYAAVGGVTDNPAGNMIRLTIEFLDSAEHTDEVVGPWLEKLVDALEAFIPGDHPIAITANAVRMNPATHVSRTLPKPTSP